MKTILDFLNNRVGSVAMMTGLLLPLILVGAGGAVDYANMTRVKANTQRTLDAAVLIGAGAYRDSDDPDVSKEAVERFLDNSMSQTLGGRYTYDVRMSKTTDPEGFKSSATVEVTPKVWFMPDSVTTTLIASEAVVSRNDMDLMLYLLVDATGSMQPLIDSVKDAALNIEAEARNALTENGIEVDRLFVKVAFFRDLRVEESRSAWIESPLFDVSETTGLAAFQAFMANEIAVDGADTPESSPASIAHALTSELGGGLDPKNTLQAIIMWTDAPGLPMDDGDIVDDITVALYKSEGALDKSMQGTFHEGEINEGYTEDSFIGSTEPASQYGCCSTLSILEREWRQGGEVELDFRVLATIAPLAEEPWATMQGWPNVVAREYTTPTASGVIDDIVSAMTKQFDPMRISR
mgnify:CR=1 FL=1